MSNDVTQTRSFALIGHSGDGKTTLADCVLMAAGVTNRLGSVEEGTSFMNSPSREAQSLRSTLARRPALTASPAKESSSAARSSPAST